MTSILLLLYLSRLENQDSQTWLPGDGGGTQAINGVRPSSNVSSVSDQRDESYSRSGAPSHGFEDELARPSGVLIDVRTMYEDSFANASGEQRTSKLKRGTL